MLSSPPRPTNWWRPSIMRECQSLLTGEEEFQAWLSGAPDDELALAQEYGWRHPSADQTCLDCGSILGSPGLLGIGARALCLRCSFTASISVLFCHADSMMFPHEGVQPKAEHSDARSCVAGPVSAGFALGSRTWLGIGFY